MRSSILLLLAVASTSAALGQTEQGVRRTGDGERLVEFVLQHPHGIYGADAFTEGGVVDRLRAEEDAVLTYIERGLTLPLPEPGTPSFREASGRNVALAAVGTLVGGERAHVVVARVSDPVIDLIAPASAIFEAYTGTPAWESGSDPEAEAERRWHNDVYGAFMSVISLLKVADPEYTVGWAERVLAVEGVSILFKYSAEQIISGPLGPADEPDDHR